MKALVALPIVLLWLSPAAAMPGPVLAVGGGTEDYGAWSDAADGWFAGQAGMGHIVVIASSPQSQWIPEYLESLGAASAVNLTIPDRQTANSPETAAVIAAADGIWFKGGDQSTYVRYRKGTLTETAIDAHHASGGVIGGTSAGCAVLGQVVYDATAGSLQPADALVDGRAPQISLLYDFLGLVPGVIFDTHFTERGRQARFLPLRGATRADADLDLVGIGVDHKTALAIGTDEVAEVIGEGAVSIFSWTDDSEVQLVAGRARNVLNVGLDQLTDGFRYDLKTRSVVEVPAYAKPTSPPAPLALPPAMGVWGDDPAASSVGAWLLSGVSTVDALEDGTLALTAGAGLLPGAVVVPDAFAHPDTVENTVGGAFFALASHPHGLALILHHDAHVRLFGPNQTIDPALPSTGPEASLLLVDTWGITHLAFSQAIAVGATKPRQSVALVGARVHLINRGAYYHLGEHRAYLRSL